MKNIIEVEEIDGINLALQMLDYYKSQQIVNRNTPFSGRQYAYAIESIKERVKLCNIRGELCRIYGKKFEELETLSEVGIK